MLCKHLKHRELGVPRQRYIWIILDCSGCNICTCTFKVIRRGREVKSMINTPIGSTVTLDTWQDFSHNPWPREFDKSNAKRSTDCHAEGCSGMSRVFTQIPGSYQHRDCWLQIETATESISNVSIFSFVSRYDFRTTCPRTSSSTPPLGPIVT